MRRILFLTLIVIMTAVAAAAQNGRVAAMRGCVENGYNFWLYAPQEYYDNPRDLFPVIIYLHGASACGSDMNRGRRYGTLNAIAMGRKVEALVINPQNPGGSWVPEKIDNILQYVLTNYRADPFRVYVLGMSLGGFGTMDYAAAYPHRVAAAMALCGGCTRRDVQPLGDVPLWIMHGTADRDVNISQSKSVVTALQQAGHDKLLRYDWLQGANHGYPARIFYLPQTYDWLLHHDKELAPDQVNRTIKITPADISNAYQGLNTRNPSITSVNSIE